MIELLAGLVLSLTAAVVGVWQVTKRDKPLHGPLDDGTLGLPRIQRWDVSYQPPRMQRLRSRFPRVEFNRIVLGICLLIAVAAGAGLWYTRSNDQTESQREAFTASLTEIATLRQQAAATRSQSEAYALLTRAQGQVADVAPQAVSDDERTAIAQEESALAAELDRVTQVARVTTAQAIGSFPDAPRGITPQLVSGAGKSYLLSDALYQIEPASATLVRLLGEGDTIGLDPTPVGRLRAIAWRDNALVALDAQRVYVFQPGMASWTIEPLAELDASGYPETTAAETFDRNLYLLTPESGQILKFTAGIYDSVPEDWNGAVAREDIESAVDLAINGHVYVALEDGRVLDFFRSRLEATHAPRVLPPVERATALVAGSNGMLHLLSEDGRILRIGADGRLLQQIVPPDTISLDGVTDITVDESSGIALLVSHDTLYLLRLPAPPFTAEPVETPAPDPPQDTPETPVTE